MILTVPKVSEFYGIAIYFYFNDHAPPHFHAEYAGQEAMIALETLRVIDGALPRRGLRLIRAWARLHTEELQRTWERARTGVVAGNAIGRRAITPNVKSRRYTAPPHRLCSWRYQLRTSGTRDAMDPHAAAAARSRRLNPHAHEGG